MIFYCTIFLFLAHYEGPAAGRLREKKKIYQETLILPQHYHKIMNDDDLGSFKIITYYKIYFILIKCFFLYLQEHIQEVLNKWQSIDDEIWAKIIVLERNRRVAKAYARAPVLTVNGSDDGFDGFRIGLAGFENPMRDQKTEEVKRNIGQGTIIVSVFIWAGSCTTND